MGVGVIEKLISFFGFQAENITKLDDGNLGAEFNFLNKCENLIYFDSNLSDHELCHESIARHKTYPH